MILNLDELDNSDNLEDGRPSNSLFTCHVTSNEDFTRFKPYIPQYKKRKKRRVYLPNLEDNGSKWQHRNCWSEGNCSYSYT